MSTTTRTATTVVNVRSPEWKAAVAAGTAVYIGRASPGFKKSHYGNMYKSPRDGTRDEVVEKYKAAWRFYLDGSFAKAYRPLLEDLRGKVLGCWCKQKGKDVRCHGDALVELLDEYDPRAKSLRAPVESPEQTSTDLADDEIRERKV